jgi:hypothetical protein
MKSSDDLYAPCIFHHLWRNTGRKTLQKRGGGGVFSTIRSSIHDVLAVKISPRLLIVFSFQVSFHIQLMILSRYVAGTPLTMDNVLSYNSESYEENCTTLNSRRTSCRFVVHKVTLLQCVGLGTSVIP